MYVYVFLWISSPGTYFRRSKTLRTSDRRAPNVELRCFVFVQQLDVFVKVLVKVLVKIFAKVFWVLRDILI